MVEKQASDIVTVGIKFMNPMITTVITTYKRPHLLKRAVKSVLKQTYPHFKVCVYDNASNDETAEIMQEFMTHDSRVEYYRHSENIGMMANYAFGYKNINTPYFSFLSDDDYFLPWFYEKAINDFKNHPDAAFTACGILAVDVNDHVVADPLSRWKKEGYYSVPNGIFELISSKYNFPLPTGVLFQREIVKDVSPDWSKEIQLMWDPDYLIQIASQFPFVISKEIATIYLAHDEAFSTGFYKRILKSAKFLDEYLGATTKLIERVMKNPHISKNVKEKIKLTYIRMLRQEMGTYIRYFINENCYSEAYYTVKTLHNHFGINSDIALLFVETFGKDKFPKISSKIQKISRALKKLFPFSSSTTKENPTLNWRSFENYKEYSNLISQ